MVAVPLLLFRKLTPDGSAPVCVIFIEAPVGWPVVVTVKLCPANPGAKVTALALVITGGETMFVESRALLLPELLSLCAVVTVIEFTFGDVALAATLTVTVIAG